MPRKKPGNQHNNRHENGIVAPGKRITKQRSNGHLNGHVTSNVSTPVVSPPSASDRSVTGNVDENEVDGQGDNNRVNYIHASQNGGAQLSENKMPLAHMPQVEVTSQHATRQPIKNNARIVDRRKDGTTNLPLTIIRSGPLADTLTILIILLSIPSTMLTLINTLFAMLTFMPPASSIFSVPNTFNDIFQGSGGSPTLATIIITDILGLLIWLVAWSPVQALAIEYAQAVVAATLGGSNNSKKRGYDSTILCLIIVSVRHMYDRGWIPQRLAVFDWRAILSRIPYTFDHKQPFLGFSNDDFFSAEPRGGWWWFRVLVALHILIQGLVHVARRWYQRKEYFHPPPTAKKNDPEVGANNLPRPGPNPLGETTLSSNNNPSPSVTPRGTLPISKDTRDKASSGKRRRKQAALVRSQQPLWAAFAATKVTILREYEHQHSAADSAEAKSRDTFDLGDAAFHERDRLTWVVEVSSDHFIIHTTLPPHVEADNDRQSQEDSPAIDRTKPFYVRINDTDWTSTSISKSGGQDVKHNEWQAEVFDLAPSSSYRCSLMPSEGGEPLDTTVVTTLPSLSEENGPNATPAETIPASKPQYSPTSPSTTLKKSIVAYEGTYNESLARQRRSKKETKAAANNIKKEIDSLHGKLSKLAGEDRAHANRHMQWNQNIKQADDAVSAMTQELESIEAVPENELHDHEQKRKEWEQAKARNQLAQDQLNRCNEAAQREKAAIESEAHVARQKKERLQARRSKLNDQLEKLESSTPPNLRSKDGKIPKFSVKEVQQMQQEQELQGQMASMQQAWQESRAATAHYLTQVQQLESAFQSEMMSFTTERPLTPEGDLPGENPQNAASAAPRIPAFGTPESSGLRSHSGSLRHTDHRLRSSSLQSSHSFDVEDRNPAPPLPFKASEAIREARKRSGGSTGGSSGSNSHPASPTGASRNVDSSLGKKSPIWNN